MKHVMHRKHIKQQEARHDKEKTDLLERAKAAEELQRSEHYAASVEYKAYAEQLKDDPQLWCKWSERYINWRQLEILGLMSKGNWA